MYQVYEVGSRKPAYGQSPMRNSQYPFIISQTAFHRAGCDVPRRAPARRPRAGPAHDGRARGIIPLNASFDQRLRFWRAEGMGSLRGSFRSWRAGRRQAAFCSLILRLSSLETWLRCILPNLPSLRGAAASRVAVPACTTITSPKKAKKRAGPVTLPSSAPQ